MRVVLLAITLLGTLFCNAQFEEGEFPQKILNGTHIIYAETNGYYGIKRSSDNEIVIQPVYAHISEIPEGIVVVKLNKNTGYERSYSSGFLNKKLKTVLPCNYRNVFSSGNGNVMASQNSDQKYGMVDTLGRILIPFNYEFLGPVSEGMIAAKQDNLFGYLNSNGKNVVPFNFKFAGQFSEGKAVATTESQMGYIDRRGHFLIPEKFTLANPFLHGFATVFINDLASVIDEKGTVLFPYLFENIEAVDEHFFVFKAPEQYRDTMSKIVIQDKQWFKNSAFSYANQELKTEEDDLLPADFENGSEFQGVLTLEGKLIGGNSFTSVTYLGISHGMHYFAVQSSEEIKKNDNWNFAVMNQEGKVLTPYEYFEVKFEQQQVVGEKEQEMKIVRYHISAEGKATKL